MNSKKRIEVFKRADALFQGDTVPLDIFDQLAEIEKDCPPEWLDRFSDNYEAALAAYPGEPPE
jgi:hypothetical protein